MSEHTHNPEVRDSEESLAPQGEELPVLGPEDANGQESISGSSSTNTDEEEKDSQESNTEDDQDVPGDTFPRSYVEELREENAKYRQRAQRADDLAARLHTSLVSATGRLQDASDLEFAQEHLDDPEALTEALDDLLAKKPHLASRKPTGNVGQGASGSHGTVDLAGLLRSRA